MVKKKSLHFILQPFKSLNIHTFNSLNIIPVMLCNTLCSYTHEQTLKCASTHLWSLSPSPLSQKKSRESQLRPDVNRLHGRKKKKNPKKLGYLRGLGQS